MNSGWDAEDKKQDVFKKKQDFFAEEGIKILNILILEE
jgi:hypothetical protein